jgi:hypothetical protein
MYRKAVELFSNNAIRGKLNDGFIDAFDFPATTLGFKGFFYIHVFESFNQ